MMNYYQGQKPTKQSKALNTGVVLYIGELPPDVDQYELHQFIISQGKFNVESLIVKPTKENKAYAYVKFKSKSEVEKARKALHMKTLREYVIRAEPFKQRQDSQAEKDSKAEENTNLFVKNLPTTTTPKDLYDLFATYGNIISIKLKLNKNGECLGYGYVNYEDSKSAESALENLNDSEFMGKRLQVSHFSPKKDRTVEEKFPLVLIKQMPNSVDSETKLGEIFSRFGQISFCGLISGNDTINLNDLQPQNTQLDNNNPRMGVVLFVKKEDASSAAKSLNQSILDESRVPLILTLAPINQETLDKLWKAKQESYKKKYEGCNLVIKNIPKEITEKNLFEIFKHYGDIAGARIATEGKMKEIKNQNGEVLDKVFQYESKGYGFVLFRNVEDARAAKEALTNQKINFKNIPLNLIVEYYDYSKSSKSELGNLNQMMNKTNERNLNKGNKRKMGDFNNYHKKKKDDLNNMEQQMVINNRTIIQPRNRVRIIFNNSQTNKPFNQNPNQNLNVNHNNAMQNIPYSMNNQQLYMQQLQKMHQMNQNRGNANQNMNTVNIPGRTLENMELVNKIKQIITIPNLEERKELLGETIFYFFLRFIPSYNLNQTFGKLTDEVLCSKLTGIFLHTDENELVNILSNMEILILTIKDVINQILQASNK